MIAQPRGVRIRRWIQASLVTEVWMISTGTVIQAQVPPDPCDEYDQSVSSFSCPSTTDPRGVGIWISPCGSKDATNWAASIGTTGLNVAASGDSPAFTVLSGCTVPGCCIPPGSFAKGGGECPGALCQSIPLPQAVTYVFSVSGSAKVGQSVSLGFKGENNGTGGGVTLQTDSDIAGTVSGEIQQSLTFGHGPRENFHRPVNVPAGYRKGTKARNVQCSANIVGKLQICPGFVRAQTLGCGFLGRHYWEVSSGMKSSPSHQVSWRECQWTWWSEICP